jgi:hypothetical protein
MTREQKLERIVEKVRKLRQTQRSYFAKRRDDVLQAAKQQEAELDRMIKRFDEEDAAERQGRLL